MYLSTNRFPTTWENGNQTSSFVFRFPTPSENGIRDSIFVFRFPTLLKMEVELVFSVFVSAFFVTFVFYLNRKNVGSSCR